MKIRTCLPASLLLASAAIACGDATSRDEVDGTPAPITSNDAQIVDFTFDGEVTAASTEEARKAIVEPALLHDWRAHQRAPGERPGRSGRRRRRERDPRGRGEAIKYKARLPVAWPKGATAPQSYDLVLPRDITKLDAFNAKYDGKCGRNEYGQATFWHDFNPKAEGCRLDDGDVVRTQAKVHEEPKDVTPGQVPRIRQGLGGRHARRRGALPTRGRRRRLGHRRPPIRGLRPPRERRAAGRDRDGERGERDDHEGRHDQSEGHASREPSAT